MGHAEKDHEDINKFVPDPQRDQMSSMIEVSDTEKISVEETDDFNETAFAELAQEMNRAVSDPDADDMNKEVDPSDLHEMGTELLENDPDAEDMNKMPSTEEVTNMNVELPADQVHTLMLEHEMVSDN